MQHLMLSLIRRNQPLFSGSSPLSLKTARIGFDAVLLRGRGNVHPVFYRMVALSAEPKPFEQFSLHGVTKYVGALGCRK